MQFKQLSTLLVNTNDTLYHQSVKAVNMHLTLRNWLFGFYIVQYEQNGEDRAEYGKSLLKQLAESLKLNGISETGLKTFRQFYLSYPEISQSLSDLFRDSSIGQTLSDQLQPARKNKKNKTVILGALSQESLEEEIKYYKSLFQKVSFSHFTELIKIKDPLKRRYYELLIIKQTLGVRELKRQVNTLSFERLGLSANKTKALAQIEKSIKPTKANEVVKDLYFFEFLQLPHKEVIEESDIEQALLNHFQEFIMELGIGFCIEARQKKILIGDEYFFIDLVLYHRILKCHVLVELKADAFNHAHIAQLNTYVNFYKKEIKETGDNPPIGILLVADKNKPLVEFALGTISNKLFVSKYQLQLPNKKELEIFVKEEMKKL
jgi:predicted nuclease of restriction endonuclease-like (RecB) superfamily